MAHGKRPGTISNILAPSSPSCPGPGLLTQSQEERRGSVRRLSERPPCTSNNGENDQLTPPVPANNYYCDPGPEDMEDTCSEYDNVGSDVEQDYDEVLHLNREAVVDMRYYKHFRPEEGGHIKLTVGDTVEEKGRAVDQFPPRPQPSTERSEGSQSDTNPHKTSHCIRQHCVPAAGEEAGRGVERGQEKRLFFSDGDEIEEVLDGARFIEDLDETECRVQRPSSLYQASENEGLRKAGNERERIDDTRVARQRNLPGGNKGREPCHVGPKEKERQGRARGRRATGEDVERVVSGIKGCTTSGAEQLTKAASKDCKKMAVRSKARSGSSKQHPPPPPRLSHAQPPANSQKAQPPGESPPSSAASWDGEPRVTKPALAHHHTQEQQKEPLEDRQRQPEKPQQVSSTNSRFF